MSPDERSLVLAMVVVPGREAISAEDFLHRFGASDGEKLGLGLLHDAVDRRDPVDVELALVVCFRFGFSDAHLAPLRSLAFADWHQRHEDVATALGRVGSPGAVGALAHLAEWVPSYLDYDDARALATKAVWALGSIYDPAARRVLESLSRADDGIVARTARAQLER
ncbi:HEAT repeat domain-containing protein [Cellulomonas sp. Sa3CUA2]|uniref:HEAT repeat domain-containing protein n=1 Tax=Cellulomonas avistercoris TaxID=2762242 RepID=A0ABR8QEN7_9CELL|nr:HEAT repeat domain-containing protein [Cellulomonas avistercoris]MBD7918826.1 HEAT repeat domain-containing protein [Cellulomonas avistercoris]